MYLIYDLVGGDIAHAERGSTHATQGHVLGLHKQPLWSVLSVGGPGFRLALAHRPLGPGPWTGTAHARWPDTEAETAEQYTQASQVMGM